MLIIEHLNHVYPGRNSVMACDDINLGVGPGEVVAIIGPNGAGKSTLLRSICRLIEPASGRIFVCGRDILSVRSRELRKIRRNVGMIFQQFNLVGRVTALQNVLAGRLGYTPTWRSILGPLGLTYNRMDRQLAFINLEKVGMRDFALQRANTLSGGQQQRVAIARLLLQGSDIILADEPVASLDPTGAREILWLMRERSMEKRIALIITLHDVNLAKEVSTRVIGMSSGKVVFDGLPSELAEVVLKRIYGSELKL